MKGFIRLLRNDPIILMLALAIFGLFFVVLAGTVGGCKSTDMGKNINITLPNLTTEQIEQIGKWVKEVQDAKRTDDNSTSAPGTTGTTVPSGEINQPAADSSAQPDSAKDNIANGGAASPEEEEYSGYRDIDRSDFNCCGMIPTYEQLMGTRVILPITISGESLNWDASGIDLTPHAGEEVKVVNVWFKEGRALLFKDWGVHNSPGADNRWHRNDDLRKDGRVVDARAIPGAQFIACVVGTWQPSGANDVSRVIAKSKVVTND